MPKGKNTIEPIDADFDEVAKAMITPAGYNLSNINNLDQKSEGTPATPRQGSLTWIFNLTSSIPFISPSPIFLP